MKLQYLRKFLWLALFLASAFAAWSWFRPYAWKSDPAALCKVVGTQVTPDREYFWVETHLEMLPGKTHDLEKPVVLLTATGEKLEPADTTLGGSEGTGTTDVWLKFWLMKNQISGPLTLQINSGKLSIKANNAVPTGPRYHVSNHW